MAVAAPRVGEFELMNLSNILWSFVVLRAYEHESFLTTVWAALARAAPPKGLGVHDRTQCALMRLAVCLEAKALEPQLERAAPQLWASLASVATHSPAARCSRSRNEVRLALERLGRPFEHDALLPEGISVDFLLAADAAGTRGSVVLEFDGPPHFLHARGEAAPVSVNGRTQLKTRLLEAMGYPLVRLPYFQWAPRHFGDEQEADLLRRLASHPLAAGPPTPSAAAPPAPSLPPPPPVFDHPGARGSVDGSDDGAPPPSFLSTGP